MKLPPKLSLLTAFVLERLRTVQIANDDALVGDAEIPQYAHTGWGQTGPNVPSGKFTPYGILLPLTATPADDGALGDPQPGWHVPYSIQSYGASREQVQLVADWFRESLAELHHQDLVLDAATYRVQQVKFETLGGVQRVPGANPSYFGQQDQFTLWLAKRRS